MRLLLARIKSRSRATKCVKESEWVDKWAGDLICAEGRYIEGSEAENINANGTSGIDERRAAIFIGPEFGTVQRADLVAAAREAADSGFDVLIACAFAYEAHTTEFSKLGRLPVLKARMNADLHMADDLKNTGKGNLFVIFGEPDVKIFEGKSAELTQEIERRQERVLQLADKEDELAKINAELKKTKDAAAKALLTKKKERVRNEIKERERFKNFISYAQGVSNGLWFVEIWGVDVFQPSTGEVRSDNIDGIACWFIDSDYNEESFFVRHAYFLGANDPYKSLKTTLKAEIDQEAWETLHSDISRPFARPSSGRIAVKVINHLGDEVMKVFRV